MQRLAITYDEFTRRATKAGCRVLSAHYRPRADERASTFTMSVRELLSENTYSVRSANAARTSFTDYTDPNAAALRFDELVSSPPLIGALLAEGAAASNSQLKEAHVISLRCNGCGRRIIVDGVHRLARLAADNHCDAPVHLVELAGRGWPVETPDFNLVCICQRQ